jgi:hypothetical protein
MGIDFVCDKFVLGEFVERVENTSDSSDLSAEKDQIRESQLSCEIEVYINLRDRNYFVD